jgi:hypothetical protein
MRRGFFSIGTIRSAALIVSGRCAMITRVICSCRKVSLTRFSISTSRWAVLAVLLVAGLMLVV